MDPIGLGLEIGGRRRVRARFVGEVEAIDLGTADERLDGRLERGCHASRHAEINESFVSRRHFAEFGGRTDVGQIESIGARRVLTVHEVPVRRVVQRGGWFRHFASDISIRISEETMFTKETYIFVHEANVYCV
jgi:hypothetical protein